MRENLAPPTSNTLLTKLGNTENQEEWRAAWTRFVHLYGPVFIVWARKYGVCESRLDELPGTLLLKLHRTMRYWEFRRWFLTVARAVGAELPNQLQAARADSKPKSQMPVARKDYWLRFLRDLTPDITESLAIHQTILADPGHRDWPRAWKGFAKTMSHTLEAWLKDHPLEAKRRADSIEAFLKQFEEIVKTTTEASLPRFHSWLHMVVKNAALDMLNEMERSQDYDARLIPEPVRQDLFAELERREVREEAERRVRKHVSNRNWDVYRQFVHERQSAREIAAHWQISEANVNQIVGRVKKSVRVEIQILTDATRNDDGE